MLQVRGGGVRHRPVDQHAGHCQGVQGDNGAGRQTQVGTEIAISITFTFTNHPPLPIVILIITIRIMDNYVLILIFWGRDLGTKISNDS